MLKPSDTHGGYYIESKEEMLIITTLELGGIDKASLRCY